jgi:Cys-rich repeat protein
MEKKTMAAIHFKTRFNLSNVNAIAVALACAFVFVVSTPASAARCVIDVDGANDEPGQKDVTQFCSGMGTGSPHELHTSASLDLTSISGGNTADVCLLFDSDSDGKINIALCTTLSGSPASVTDVRMLTCNDAATSKCGGAVKINVCSNSGASCFSDADCGVGTCSAQFNTACTASQKATDPFLAGDDHPWDTVIDCAIDLDEFGPAGVGARLINMGAYSSSSLNSDMSDSVLPPMCQSNSDCKGGKVCHIPSGECYAPRNDGCTSDEQCAADENCDLETGNCVPGGCTSDADCPAGKVCNVELGECVIPTDDGCTEDVDCAEGLVCDVATGECYDPDGPPCTIDSDCPAGQVCNATTGECQDPNDDGRCSSDADCPPHQVCNVIAGYCVDPNDPCTSDEDCREGEVCDVVTGLCESPCTSDADCSGLDSLCSLGVCDLESGACIATPINEGATCGEEGTCSANGGICTNGECVAATVCDPVCSLCDGGHCLSLCGNPYAALTTGVNATDALYILRASVALEECAACICDVNNSGKITAVDALAALRVVVRLPGALSCPANP